MRRHRGGYWVAWSVVTGASLVLGTAITVLIDPPAALILMAVMATGAACLLSAVVKQAEKSAARFVLRTAPLLLLVLAGVNGLAAALGPATIALVVTLAITGVPLVWRGWSDTEPEPAPVQPAGPPKQVIRPPIELTMPSPAADLQPGEAPTTAALCWTWRISFTALRKADGLDERLRIVELRQRCLDELARREPAGFRKWLETGARAAGDPTKYVCMRPKAAAGEERRDEHGHDG